MGLTTVKRYKTYYELDLADTSKDALYEMLIEQVSSEIEGKCRRNFTSQEYELDIEGSGSTRLVLPDYPLTGDELTVEDADGNAITDFTINATQGILTRTAGWDRTSIYTVTFTAGYVLPTDAVPDEGDPACSLPADLMRTANCMVNFALQTRDSEHLQREDVGPLKSTYLPDIPIYLQNILDRYTKKDIL